jgi:hypothetical protein
MNSNHFHPNSQERVLTAKSMFSPYNIDSVYDNNSQPTI